MPDNIFDGAFLQRLALAIRTVEEEGLQPNDPAPLNAADYQSIYAAYEDSGGDPEAAKRQIALARERCDQALGRILQFISDQYGFGPIEQLSDERLKDVARDALDATECWIDEVEMHRGRQPPASSLRTLLQAHYQFNEAVIDLQDEILWPMARRIFPER